MISEDEVDKCLSWLRDNAEKDAQARAERLYMTEWIKVVLAQEQAQSKASSMAAAEMSARISGPYVAALDAYKQAIYEDERRRFLRSAAETKVLAWQTQSANERAHRV